MPTKRRAPGRSEEGRAGTAGRKRKVRFQKSEDIDEEESDDARLHRRRPPVSRRMPDDEEEEEEDYDEEEGFRGQGARRRVRGGARGRGGRSFDYDDEEEEEDEEDEQGGGRRRRARRKKGRREEAGVSGARSGGGFDGDEEEEDDEPEVERMVEKVHGEEEEDEHYEKTNEAGDPIEPFNLRNERDIGYFDTNGNFVWKREENERDAWLAEMDEGAMEEAIGAASSRAAGKDGAGAGAGAAGGAVAATLGGGDSVAGMGTAEMREALIPLLEEDETVVKALRRLGKRTEGARGRGRLPGDKKKPRAAKQSGEGQVNGKAASELDGDGEANGGTAAGQGSSSSAGEAERERQEKFSRLTDLADELLQAGMHDVYQLTKEELEEAAAEAAEKAAARASSSASYFGGAIGGGVAGYQGEWMQMQQQQQHRYEASAAVGEAGAAGTDEKAYFEYRGKDGNIHGPYGASQMKAWVQQGYFDGDQAVTMRKTSHGSAKISEGEGVDMDEGGTGGDTNGDSSRSAKSSNADLMADLDDDEDEEGEDTGGEKGVESGDWVMSNHIDWSLY